MEEIRDYYLIGDLHSAALVSKKASIDWLCLPHFDSPSIFAKLLDKKAGSFAISDEGYKVSSRYIPEAAILEFEFIGQSGSFLVRDFMVPKPDRDNEHHLLVRNFQGLSGKCQVRLNFDPRPNYANKDDKKEIKNTNNLRFPLGEDALLIRLPDDAFISQQDDGGFEILFEIVADQKSQIVLEYIPGQVKADSIDYAKLERQTIQYWKSWLDRGDFFDFCKQQLIRSAITLKLMQFYPTGALIAAPTTSLPEILSGKKNWDYRYVWIRDATFALYGFYVLGYEEEAKDFFDFIQRVILENKDQDIELVYTIEGKKIPQEKFLNNFSGFKNSRPVRIGNAARFQLQLDLYGSLIDAYYFMCKRGMSISDEARQLIILLVEKINQNWQKKDHGIWEMRGKSHHYTYSKVMCWVGVNRALRMISLLNISKELEEKWRSLEKMIEGWIWENCFNERIKSFTQYPGAKKQDATNFLFVLLQFLDKHDPLTKTIIENTCQELLEKQVFVYRYRREGEKEGAFVLCTFWLISALAIYEDLDWAVKIFAEFDRFIDETGLLSEEIDPKTHQYLGNFPQAFSHLGLIMSAYYIQKYQARKNS